MLGLLAGGMLYRVLEERVFVWAAAIAAIAWAAAWRLPVSSPTARSSGSQ
jgi:hypothetical protein